MKTLIIFGILTGSQAAFGGDCSKSPGAGRSADEKCLACACLLESEDQGKVGQISVVKSIINRVKDVRFPSKRFPDTACGVVYEKGQYQWVRQQKRFRSVPKGHACWGIASRALDNDFTGLPNANAFKYTSFLNAKLYFNVLRASDPWWKEQCTSRSTQIGQHLFCGTTKESTSSGTGRKGFK